MEDDELQRPYSVTIDDLKEKIHKQINDISEIFCLSNSDATVLLMKLRWNSQLLSERLCQEKKKLLNESGLKPVVTDTIQDLSDSSCDEFYDFFDDVDDDVEGDDVKISTPFCSHKFSVTYWSKYLEKNFFSVEKTLATISCPHHDCGAAVGRDTVEKLKLKDIYNRYDEYVVRSYLERSKKRIKQCPAAQGCSYFIEFPRSVDAKKYGSNVVCLCGHTFCWRCRLESHRPVTCNNASDWLSRDLEKLTKSLSVSWIEANTKPCPHCLSPVEIGLGSLDSKFVPCAYCSGSFCWECMQTEESHKTESGSYDGDCVEPETEEDPPEVDTSCLDRWEAGEVSLVEAKSELQAFEESNNMNEEYTRMIREGLMLIVQCRQFLKWTCVYEHLHLEYEDSKKEFLRFLQNYASTLVKSFSETLKEETKKALTEVTEPKEVTCSGGNLSAVTSSIGNYFYNFSKALRDGLDVVEVKHYDDSSPCWLCDRCTYANTWLHKACKMFCDESPLDKTK